MAATLVLALTVPAVGKNTDWFGLSDRANKNAKTAKKRAKKALRKARQARKRATKAKRRSGQAIQQAGQASQQAGEVSIRLDGTRIVSESEPGLVTSTAPIGSYAARGGPSVEITVPSSGLIEVWAQAEINDDDGGAVGLYEDGQKVPGVSEPNFCGDDSALIEMDGGGSGDFETFSTPPIVNLTLGCTSTGAPAPVILRRPPGNHTYELRYSLCQCPGPGAEAEFRNRVLRVGPRL
jgi:hypothetical protein